MRTVKTDQADRMPRLIGVIAGCTGHFVGFVMRRLNVFNTAFISAGIQLKYIFQENQLNSRA